MWRVSSHACARPVQRLAAAGMRVSLFIDADPQQVEASREVGAPCIEIHTGHYADAAGAADADTEYRRIVAAVALGTARPAGQRRSRAALSQCAAHRGTARDARTEYRPRHYRPRPVHRPGQSVAEMKRLMSAARGPLAPDRG